MERLERNDREYKVVCNAYDEESKVTTATNEQRFDAECITLETRLKAAQAVAENKMIVLQEEMIQKMQNVKDNHIKGLYFKLDKDNMDNSDNIAV